jgi:hypothetical protein
LGSGLRETHFRNHRHYFAPLNLKLALSLTFEIRQSAPIRLQYTALPQAVKRILARCPFESS